MKLRLVAVRRERELLETHLQRIQEMRAGAESEADLTERVAIQDAAIADKNRELE
jgi:hypothetical protein